MSWTNANECDVTRDDVIAAIDECDRLGRRAFLGKYGFGPARRYYIVYNGSYYDSKAIWAVAFGRRFPERDRVAWNDFHGRSGKTRVERLLIDLGFQVERRSAIPL